VATLLIGAGATTTGARRLHGQTLLMHAVQRRDPDVTKLLLQHTGAQGINETDHLGRTALHMACEGNRLEVIKVLLLAGADYKRRDTKGRTPLESITLKHVVDGKGKPDYESAQLLKVGKARRCSVWKACAH
jgi:ankyrin repeat protein